MQTKINVVKNTGSKPARFKLLTSAAMVAMALTSMSASAGPGKVCLDGATPLAACAGNTINTYYANSPKLRKFVDTLPGLTAGNTSAFASGQPGNYLAVGVADTASYPGSDYYIIGVVEHQQRMHSDLQKETTLRGYVQLYPRLSERPAGATNPPAKAVDIVTKQALPAPVALTYPDGTPIVWPGSLTPATPVGEQVYAYNKPNYLGPNILSTTGTPVRAQMVNLLPTGRATRDANGNVTARNGDIFLPVDESLGGAGLAPVAEGATPDKYPQNRVSFHLHGGDSPWISDGTPHQWITPAADASPHKSGNRQMNVPDMPFPGEGSLTLFYPNDQSARLMWYHDHTFGLTRQNAYGGEAAGYLIMDAAETALLNGGTVNGQTIAKAIPNTLLDQIVLVIQDKTFVPNDINIQDAKWDTKAWGQPGDLWFPHVYEPFQLWGTAPPAGGISQDVVGVNPAGRWDYALNDLDSTYLPPKVGATRLDPDYGMVAFPDGSNADGTAGKGPSATPESYMDTPVINGVAYPVMNVEPKAYRVRFLNGANDRYFNISLWKADPSQTHIDPVTGQSVSNTEVKTIPFGGAGNTSNDPAGIPDPTTAGPSIIQFANEAGFMPTPVVHKPTLMSFDLNGEEVAGDFYLGSAERADTVIDFSQFAGQTIIMYNDGTAPVPGGDARYDYYTGNADQTPFGGAPSTEAGYGPNTRTMMQIRVAPTLANGTVPKVTDAYDPAGNGGALSTELPKAYAAVAEPHIESAMPLSVNADTHTMILANRSEVELKVKTISGYTDSNIGRLIAQLGTELPGTTGATPLSYIDMPTEILKPDEVQYWWIKNYDVDNHPMHFHLFNVQVLAHRLNDGSGTMMPPKSDEMGWKETVKNWPGADVIVALKPKTPQLPFGLPNSVRTLDPTMKDGATANDVLYGVADTDGSSVPFAFNQTDLDPASPTYGSPMAVSNTVYNFGWEYVWHCHILGHEENDLMRPMAFYPVIAAPSAPTNVAVDANGKVTWTDPTPALDSFGKVNAVTKGNAQNEIGFRVERAPLTAGVPAPTAGSPAVLAAASPVVDSRVNTLANATLFQDQDTLAANTDYQYQVFAVNEGGEVASAPFILKFGLLAPVVSAMSTTVNGVPQTTISWTDTSTGEAVYTLERCAGTTVTCAAPAAAWVLLSSLPSNSTSYVDTTTAGAVTYLYRVKAVNGATVGLAGTSVQITAATTVKAPALVTPLSATSASVALSWTDNSTNETSFQVLRRVSGTGAFVVLATVARTGTATTSAGGLAAYTDATVVSGTAYDYQVLAVNTNGATVSSSVPSIPASVLVPLAAAPTGLAANVSNGTSVVLSWVDSSVNETAFQVTRTGGTGPALVFKTPARSTALKVSVGGAVTYTDATALPLTDYVYAVAPVTSAAAAVPAVLGASVSVPARLALNAPTSASAVQTATGITVTWPDTSNNDIGFQIVRKGGAASVTFKVTSTAAQKTAVTGVRTYIDTTALPGVAYTYSVATTGGTTALPVYSSAVESNSVTALVTAPGVPTAVITSATSITLSWTDLSSNETGFLVERSTNGGSTFATLTTVARTAATTKGVNTAVSYVDRLVAATAVKGLYQYRVTAVNQTGTGIAALTNASSAPVTSASLDFTLAAIPTALTATAAAVGQVSLSWTDNASNETGFSVQRATDAGFTKGLKTTAVPVVIAGTGGTASYLVSGLTSKTAYFFRVAATNAVGTSAYLATPTAVAAP